MQKSGAEYKQGRGEASLETMQSAKWRPDTRDLIAEGLLLPSVPYLLVACQGLEQSPSLGK